jgi:hypothetical protein
MKNQFRYWSTADKTAWYVDVNYPDRDIGDNTTVLGPFKSLKYAMEAAEKHVVD